MMKIREYYDRGKLSFIGQFVFSRRVGDGAKVEEGGNRYFSPLQV